MSATLGNTYVGFRVTQVSRMNRLYITGDLSGIKELLSDFRASFESRVDGVERYWLPLHRSVALHAALGREAAYQAERTKEREAWETARSVIPGNYKTRHGAALGGVVTIDGESISEPAMDSRNLPWVRVASYERRVRDLTGQSSINGRVRDSDTLYACQMADGRAAYRIAHYGGFGDDLRETYYLPADAWTRLMMLEVQSRKITRESAAEWLDKYRGCVGTELYEFAMSMMAQTLTAPTPGTLSVRREIGAGT